jgi:hypothetical protein
MPYTVYSFDKDTLTAYITFSEDCIYDEALQGHTGWNKVGYWYIGQPHKNGVTFTWRCIGNSQLLLGWYGWEDGISPMEAGMNNEYNGTLCEVEPGIEYCLQLIRGDSMEFRVNGVGIKTRFSFKPNTCLAPYFGGLSTAPHRMTIEIEYR